MTWVRLDDGFFEHPKTLRAGEDAAYLFLAGLAYCNRRLTDGVILKSIVPRLTARRTTTTLAARLVEVGYWHDEGDHYRVHEYLTWNPSRAAVESKRERDRKRKGVAAESRGPLLSAPLPSHPSPQTPGTNGAEPPQRSAPTVRRKAASGAGEMPPIDSEILEMLAATEHLKPLTDPKYGRFWRTLERELEPYDWLVLDDEMRAADGWIAANPSQGPTVGGLADFFRRWCRKTVRDRQKGAYGQATAQRR